MSKKVANETDRFYLSGSSGGNGDPGSDRLSIGPTDRFDIGATIREGRWATVTRAYDRWHERNVVLKTPAGPPRRRRHAKVLLLREARAYEALKGIDGLLTYHGTAEVNLGDRITPAIVLEFVPGGDLRFWKSGLSMEFGVRLKEIVPVFNSLVTATGAFHDAGFVHCDLKPDNAFLNGGRVKVGDFGAAVFFGEDNPDTFSTESAGAPTPEYMSPEQCAGQSVGKTTDIYSLGVILYEFTSSDGALPFEGSEENVARAHMSAEFPVRNWAPPELEAIIAHCCQKDPGERFEDCAALLAALQKAFPVKIKRPRGKNRRSGGAHKARTTSSHVLTIRDTTGYEKRVAEGLRLLKLGALEAAGRSFEDLYQLAPWDHRLGEAIRVLRFARNRMEITLSHFAAERGWPKAYGQYMDECGHEAVDFVEEALGDARK